MSNESFVFSHTRRGWLRAIALIAATWCGLPALAGIDVNPVFPAYGQAVAIELNSIGPAPWVPATRYRRDGNSFTLEMENMPGGFFGPRTDMQYMPVNVGELAPGNYWVQARLYDLGDPTLPPRLFTHSLQVAPPDAPGVYSVPRIPGALEPFELTV